MNIKYVINNCHALLEKDNYIKGCYGETKHAWPHIGISANTITELLQKLQDEFNCAHDDIELNSCDENGRVDIVLSQLKPFDCTKISEESYNKFKDGEIDLWCTSYIMHVEMITTDIDLEAILKSENNS